jgi:ABC-type branched-subunit amino acid transport system ATPase component
MDETKPLGLYLLQKQNQKQVVLKDLLQLLRTTSPGKSTNFSYIEAQSSLLPDLTLWENLKLEVSSSSWNEMLKTLETPLLTVANLIVNYQLPAGNAQVWEKFLLSLLKGLMSSSPNLLVDMNEDVLDPFVLQNCKRILFHFADQKQIYLASANTSLWLDSAHCLVTRSHYQFKFEKLEQNLIKRRSVA